jgi:hypothetical protein
MLLKASVSEFHKFVLNHSEFFNKQFLETFQEASYEVKEITLHKMIVGAKSLPFEHRMKSAEWLTDRGYSFVV